MSAAPERTTLGLVACPYCGAEFEIPVGVRPLNSVDGPLVLLYDDTEFREHQCRHVVDA